MKKSIALLLAGMLLLSACQPAGSNAGNESESKGQSGQSVVEESAENDSPEKAAQALPKINIENSVVQRYTDDGETMLVEIRQDNMTLEGDGYEKAAETVKGFFYRSEEDLSRQADDLLEMAQEQYADEQSWAGEYYWFSAYTATSSYEIERLDTKVLSLKIQSYDYEGGAHGYGAEWGATIDLESGVELELSRLAADAPRFMDKLTGSVLESLSKRTDELFDDYESYVTTHIEEVSWYLDAAGIWIVFTPYEIGPYASGSISVLVPYGEVADYMKSEYLAPQGAFITRLSRDSEVNLELADGAYTVSWRLEYAVQYDDYESTLIVNGGKSLVEPFVRVLNAYLIGRPDGRNFLIFDIDWASDDYETFVYELAAGRAVQTADVWAALDGKNMNTDDINLRFILNVLGTYSTEMHYALTEDGGLEPLEEIFEITPNMEWQGLTTVRELPVTIDGQQTTLPAGTSLHITATDNASTAWFTTAEDADAAISGAIHYERREDDYQLYIDGISEYEYFDMLPYAG